MKYLYTAEKLPVVETNKVKSVISGQIYAQATLYGEATRGVYGGQLLMLDQKTKTARLPFSATAMVFLNVSEERL